MDMKELLFSFQGRISRKPFWLTILALFVLGVVINLVAFGAIAATGAADPEGGGGGALAAILGIVLLAVGLVSLWIGLAVQAKRWHDQDKSAWWILVNLVPGVGGLIVLIMCGFLEGTPGSNRFGPEPA